MSEGESNNELNNKLNDNLNEHNTRDDTQYIDPWTVKGGTKGFNYLKLLRQFGTKPITPELIKRIEASTNMRVHKFLRRGLFFSQQDLEQFLDHYDKGLPVYLYTGRGPSSESMHLGHMVPFEFTKYLQDAFGCILVVQMSDDEKFYFKGEKSLEYYNGLARENAKDIIAVGFDPAKTYIFSNYEELCRGNPGLIRNMVVMNSNTTTPQIRAIFGLDKPNENGENKTSIGMMSWPVYQSIPAFSSSFDFIFKGTNAMCLVPMACDQSPYFRLARDVAAIIEAPKPSCLHSEFLVGLSGRHSKMSSTETVAPIFLTDTREQVLPKIKGSFSGGRETGKLHRELGGDLEVDVAFQWLLYLLDDDAELERIAIEYSSGRMMTSELKSIMAKAILDYLTEHQKRRELVTPEVIGNFFNPHREFDHSRPAREPIQLLNDAEYEKQGANFDRYFGCLKSA